MFISQIPWESLRDLSDTPDCQALIFSFWVARMGNGRLPRNTLIYRIIQLQITSLEIRKKQFICEQFFFFFKGVNQEFEFGHIELEIPKRTPGVIMERQLTG